MAERLEGGPALATQRPRALGAKATAASRVADTVESLDLLAARLAAVMGCVAVPRERHNTRPSGQDLSRLADRTHEELAALDAVNEVDRPLYRSCDRGRPRTPLGLSTRGGRRAGH